MTTPTTIRLPNKLLEQIDRRARARKKDRASMIRELLREGLARDLEDEVFTAYREGRLSLSQAASIFLDVAENFKRRSPNLIFNIDSSKSPMHSEQPTSPAQGEGQ